MKITLLWQERLIGIYFLLISILFLIVQVIVATRISENYISIGFYKESSFTEVRIYCHELLRGFGYFVLLLGSIGLLLRKSWGWQLLVGSIFYLSVKGGYNVVKLIFDSVQPFEAIQFIRVIILVINLVMLFRLIQYDFQKRFELTRFHLLVPLVVILLITLLPLGIEKVLQMF
jgi:hypothetical protein